ncbi:DUF559 domain-containing protein [Ammoniphilus sp. CFH 90114]|uniref:DUF559 domain-containing protein n=1 Tax=Ammoniphilus sp. CFH 90114 TaxID=2493665 RepID=UPI00100E0BB9|nr:DUF559 domain-containing protein [Ammoniphilus sp. CFH 90114]RXT03655.1 DUF559 domain-containing protein [Ammoniphilus sp. CFH 90114]
MDDLNHQAYEILGKVKNVFHLIKPTNCGLPSDRFSTVEMVAEYYEVEKDTVNTLLRRHRRRLKELGIVKLSGAKLKSLKFHNRYVIGDNTPSLLVIPGHAFLEIGVLLKCSVVALEVCRVIISTQTPGFVESLTRINGFLVKQNSLKKVLSATFEGFPLDMEVWIDNKYRVDFLINNKVIVECDEFGHKERSNASEKEREYYIRQKGYHIIRFNPDSEDDFELCKLVKRVVEALMI